MAQNNSQNAPESLQAMQKFSETNENKNHTDSDERI